MSGYPNDDPLFDYKLYRLGRGRQVFRGPEPEVRGRYLCFLGGSPTFGRFVHEPFPQLVGAATGLRTLNLGAEGAGPGFFLNDPDVLGAASDAELCVVQAMCASAISNRMFTVRPRRNGRLHGVSDLLRAIYPEVEFERFAFVRPLLRHLQAVDAGRFAMVENEMKNAWIGRTQTLLGAIGTRTVLLWFAQRSPDGLAWDGAGGAACQPLFVDRAMVEAVSRAADGYVEAAGARGLPQDLRVNGMAMLHRPSGEPIEENREFPSPEMHRDAAAALMPEVERLLGWPAG